MAFSLAVHGGVVPAVPAGWAPMYVDYSGCAIPVMQPPLPPSMPSKRAATHARVTSRPKRKPSSRTPPALPASTDGMLLFPTVVTPMFMFQDGRPVLLPFPTDAATSSVKQRRHRGRKSSTDLEKPVFRHVSEDAHDSGSVTVTDESSSVTSASSVTSGRESPASGSTLALSASSPTYVPMAERVVSTPPRGPSRHDANGKSASRAMQSPILEGDTVARTPTGQHIVLLKGVVNVPHGIRVL